MGGATLLLLLSRGVVPPSGPIGVLGGLIARFRAKSELLAAVPGGLEPGIPAGTTDLPWAGIHEIGGTRIQRTSGGRAEVHETAMFQVDIAARSMQEGAAIADLLGRTFSPQAVAADPIALRSGYIRKAAMRPGMTNSTPEPVKGGGLAYRVMVEITATAVRPWTEDPV